MSQFLIFGYGSLINSSSLKTTVPDAYDIKPAYIRGFRRNFCAWDSAGFTDTNLDLAHVPYCAVDVTKTQKKDDRVNGVVFSMSDINFQKLLSREAGYELIPTEVYDYESGALLGNGQVFSAKKKNGRFDNNGNKAQQRYLEICLMGAQEYGQQFYQDFLTNTYIGNKSLNMMPDLLEF